ncbi:MAG TPA: hypothetical protein VI911_12140 [Patescibacteria group bacterium]|nr:hypothetical protein [Patescibacteria group bacterium]
MWLIFTKVETQSNQIFVGGIIWDFLLSLSFIIVPFLFCSIKLNKVSLVGLFICIIGLILLKGGDWIEQNL